MVFMAAKVRLFERKAKENKEKYSFLAFFLGKIWLYQKKAVLLHSLFADNPLGYG